MNCIGCLVCDSWKLSQTCWAHVKPLWSLLFPSLMFADVERLRWIRRRCTRSMFSLWSQTSPILQAAALHFGSKWLLYESEEVAATNRHSFAIVLTCKWRKTMWLPVSLNVRTIDDVNVANINYFVTIFSRGSLQCRNRDASSTHSSHNTTWSMMELPSSMSSNANMKNWKLNVTKLVIRKYSI